MRKSCTMILVLLLTFSSITPAFAKEDLGQKIVSIADDYIGIPYRSGGTTTAGFDCSGFTSFVFNKVGIQIPRTAESQYGAGKKVNKKDLQPGDLVFFQTTSKRISHVGIYIGNNKFISSTSSSGIRIDSLNDPYYWGSRYVGAARIITEEDNLKAMIQSLQPGEFLDVPSSSWMYESIHFLSKEGIITGYDGYVFKPDNAISRAEAAKLISATFNLEPSGNSVNLYEDVADNYWANDYIIAATEQGFLTGYDGKFNPDEPITRAEVAAVITRAFDLQLNGKVIPFKDLPQEHWAYEYIQSMATNGIAKGYEDQTFKASQPTTRGEFSSLLYSAIKN